MTSVMHPKERLITTAARLVHKQGWTATGINQILMEADIPKGSFYYYFRSKEALGVAVIRHHQARMNEILAATLNNTSLSAAEALTAFFAELSKLTEQDCQRYGSPLGSFANEVAATSELLSAEARAAIQSIEQSFADTIQRGQSAGAIPTDLNAADMGRMMLILIEGSFLRMKCAAPTEPLALQMTKDYAFRLLFGNTRGTHLKAVEMADDALRPLAS